MQAGGSLHVFGASVSAHDSWGRANPMRTLLSGNSRASVGLSSSSEEQELDQGPAQFELIHSTSTDGHLLHQAAGVTVAGVTPQLKKLLYFVMYVHYGETHNQSCFSSWPPIPAGPRVTCPVQVPREHPTGVWLVPGSDNFLRALAEGIMTRQGSGRSGAAGGWGPSSEAVIQ